MCYDVVSETAPPYLSDLLHLYIPSCSLHSSADAHTFWIPKQKKNFQGQCTFSHLGPVTWDKLPYSVCYAATKSQFKTQNHTITLSPWTTPKFPVSIANRTTTNPHFLFDLPVMMYACCTHTCLHVYMHVCMCASACMCVCVCVCAWACACAFSPVT